MSIQVGCEGCGKIYTVDDRFAGKKAKCKTCGAVMTVPGGAKPAAPGGAARSSSAGAARAVSSSSSQRTSSTAAAASSARPPARKPVAVEAKADPSDFDLSALDAIEQSGEVDHDYV